MNARRIKCILSGGHRYRDADTQSHCDEKKKRMHYHSKMLQVW